MKLAILGNYTLDLLTRELDKKMRNSGIDLKFYLSGFNQYVQDILKEDSMLYRFNPNAVILSIYLKSFVNDILTKIMDLKSTKVQSLIMERFNELIQHLELMASRLPESLILIDNFYLAERSIMGTLEYNSDYSKKEVVHILNLELSQFIKKHKNIKIIDVNSLIYLYGTEQLFDFRLYYTTKMHWSAFGLEQLASLYLRYIKAYLGIRKKLILLDLDNTLWGGIIGDDGIENIDLSNDGPGKAYYDFQYGLLQLFKRGVLLAICSKNSEDLAMDAIRKHPYMLLRPEHFASVRINWENKVKNIKEIAQELNIGLDSMVFLDDSPFERALVKDQLKDVLVPDMPDDPANYLEFLSSLGFFDFYDLTEDDFKRTQMYKENIKRKKLKETSTNIESYYRSLNMAALIKKVDELSLTRVAQLTQKTNQFNLTTRRYTEADLKTFKKNEQYKVFQLRLEDKFGDNGVVGVSILKIEKNTAYIDTFLLSCRVLGREVERAFLYFIIEQTAKLGLSRLIGEYIPTKKNMPCSNLYRDHGFKEIRKGEWLLDLNNNRVSCPPWISIKEV